NVSILRRTSADFISWMKHRPAGASVALRVCRTARSVSRCKLRLRDGARPLGGEVMRAIEEPRSVSTRWMVMLP
ncbi:MAG: hypothetical protein QOD99_2511, partial [Chthoniobacter sp.]|nr:hypothetical protein [Chthoniobacter sp.]